MPILTLEFGISRIKIVDSDQNNESFEKLVDTVNKAGDGGRILTNFILNDNKRIVFIFETLLEDVFLLHWLNFVPYCTKCNLWLNCCTCEFRIDILDIDEKPVSMFMLYQLETKEAEMN